MPLNTESLTSTSAKETPVVGILLNLNANQGEKKGLRRVAGNGVQGKHPRNFDAAYATSRYVPINSTVLDIVFSEFLSALRSFSHCFVIVTEHQVHIYILYCLS